MIWQYLSTMLACAIASVIVYCMCQRTLTGESPRPRLYLPGWFCRCGVFNGEAKGERAECRSCGNGK
jgi:hypothetical protein